MIENINNSHDLSTKDIKSYEDHCKIIVIGAGGAGCNAVNKMIKDKVLLWKYIPRRDRRKVL